MSTFRVYASETEHKKAYIDAATPEEAEQIALESLDGERNDVYWDVYHRDFGDLETCLDDPDNVDQTLSTSLPQL